MRRTILLAVLAAASAQLEHSISEATSWSSLRRAALGDKGAERLEETLELGGKRRGGASRSWSGMVYDRLPNAMQSVGIGQDLFRAAKKDPQLANTLKEAAAGYYRKASGMPEPGQQPGIDQALHIRGCRLTRGRTARIYQSSSERIARRSGTRSR